MRRHNNRGGVVVGQRRRHRNSKRKRGDLHQIIRPQYLFVHGCPRESWTPLEGSGERGKDQGTERQKPSFSRGVQELDEQTGKGARTLRQPAVRKTTLERSSEREKGTVSARSQAIWHHAPESECVSDFCRCCVPSSTTSLYILLPLCFDTKTL